MRPQRIENGGGHGFVGGLAAPDHQLKGRIEALAFDQRQLDQIFDLLGADAGHAAQQQGMAEHDRLFFGGDVEMPDPQPLVDAGEKIVDHGPDLGRNLGIEAAAELQCARLFLPDEEQAVIGPASADLDQYLVIRGPLERPIVRDHQFLDQVERVDLCGRGFQ
jgi:hypothetical protein